MFFERRTVTNTIKGDLTSQITQKHLVKFGLEYRLHNLKYYNAELQPPRDKTAIDLFYDSPFLENPQALARLKRFIQVNMKLNQVSTADIFKIKLNLMS